MGWRGIEVVGSKGTLYNFNNTAIGLHLCRGEEGTEPGRLVRLKEVEGVFQEYQAGDRGYDEEGWLDPGEVMRHIVQAVVEALETGAELKVTTGDDLRHALEIAIALRESHRRGHVPVKLPLEDRSLVMYPVKTRWHYKKEVYGREWYMEQLALSKNS